jgi:hypothetical protein
MAAAIVAAAGALVLPFLAMWWSRARAERSFRNLPPPDPHACREARPGSL